MSRVRDSTASRCTRRISEGRLASEMPAWKQVATPQQIADVAEYVFQSFIRNEPVKAAAQTAK